MRPARRSCPLPRHRSPAHLRRGRHLLWGRVDICRSRRAKRKGAVYKAQRWWRTAEVETPEQIQSAYDRFCFRTGDSRPRGEATVADLAANEQLRGFPDQPYPTMIELV